MSIDREEARAIAFERQLLESARADDSPHGVDQAWARLAGALAAIDIGTAVGDGVGGGGHVPPVSAESLAVTPVVRGPALIAIGAQSSRKAVMTWLLVGAIGGGAVTAFTTARSTTPLPGPVLPAAAPAPAVAVSGVAVPAIAAVDVSLTPAVAPMSPQAPRQRGGRRVAKAPRPRLFATARARLAAEVASLEAARAALAAGDHDDALWLIDRHQQDFPAGSLAPDAEVVALQALVAKRDRTAVVRRAARFLAEYPRDPHVARVEAMRRRHLDSAPVRATEPK